MTQHLSPEEFVAAVEGALTAGREAHVSTCGACNGQIAELRVVLEALRAAPPVPDPPPVFWSHLSDRIRAATISRRGRWWTVALGAHSSGRSWLAAGVAVAALVLALVWHGTMPATSTPVPASVRSDEAAWDSVADLASGLSTDDVRRIVAAPADAPLVSELTPAERAQFVQLVQQEIGVDR